LIQPFLFQSDSSEPAESQRDCCPSASMHDCCQLVSHQAEVAERVQPPCVAVSGWLAPGTRSVAGAWPVSRHQPLAGAWPLPVAVLVASLWSAVVAGAQLVGGAQLMVGTQLVVGAEWVAQGSPLCSGRDIAILGGC